jgi:uncharacterized membrane protein
MISADDHIGILACLFALVTASIMFEYTRLGKLFPASIGMLVGGIVLANTPIMPILPHQAAAYTAITELAIPIAVFLFLLRANLREIIVQTGSMLRYYLIGAAATVFGVVVTFFILPVPDGARASAVFIGMLVGGTPNVVGVSQAVEIDPTHLSAILAGNVPAASVYLMLVAALGRSAIMQRLFPGKGVRPATNSMTIVAGPETADDVATETRQDSVQPAREPATPVKLEALHVALITAGGLAVFIFAQRGLQAVGLENYLISLLTFLSLVIANVFPNTIKRLTGDREIAMVIMLLFFGTVGVKVDLARFGGDAVMFALFYGLATLIHMVILFTAAKFMKGELQEVLIGSVAGIGGPTSAAAMGATYQRPELITPGILCALLGYAIATFIGLAVYGALS